MAMSFADVTADVIEAQEFPRLSQQYMVSGVPKTVANNRVEVLGAMPEARFIGEVLRALPDAAEPEAEQPATGPQSSL